jgi:hypothetical protein
VTRRTVLVSAGWLGAAVLAVLVGLAAVRVIGDGLTSEAARPRTEAEVASTLAARGVTAPGASPAATATAPTGPASPRGSTASTVVPRSFHTRGGTVVAKCVGGRAEMVSVSPATGFAVHERDQGPQTEAEGEFRSTADNHDRVRFRIACADGRPELSERDR